LVISDFFKNFELIFATIEDGNWSLILSSTFPEQPSQQLSSITIGDEQESNRGQPGSRSITANITSDDPLERMLAYSLAVLSASLLLKTAKQQIKGVNRRFLCTYVNTLNKGLSTLVGWYDDCLVSSSYTDDYKSAVKEVYGNCSLSIINFNEFINTINNGKSTVEWVQPDDPSKQIPELTLLPAR
jgi:hypothetical protein